MIKYRPYQLRKDGPHFIAAYIFRVPVRKSWYIAVCMN